MRNQDDNTALPPHRTTLGWVDIKLLEQILLDEGYTNVTIHNTPTGYYLTALIPWANIRFIITDDSKDT